MDKLKRYLMVAGAIVGGFIPIIVEVIDFTKTISLDENMSAIFSFYIYDLKTFIAKTIFLMILGAVIAWYSYEKFVWARKVYRKR